MRNLTIAYDLCEPNKNYDDVIDSIKVLGSWAHPQGSLWYVKSDHTASTARDAIVRAMDRGDTLIVVDSSTNEIAWHNITAEVANFYRSHWSA